MKISKYWSLSRGLCVYNFSAWFPPFIYYSYNAKTADHPFLVGNSQ